MTFIQAQNDPCDNSRRITNNPQVKWCNYLQEEPQVQSTDNFSRGLQPIQSAPETTHLFAQSEQNWKQVKAFMKWNKTVCFLKNRWDSRQDESLRAVSSK